MCRESQGAEHELEKGQVQEEVDRTGNVNKAEVVLQSTRPAWGPRSLSAFTSPVSLFWLCQPHLSLLSHA